MMSQAEKNFNSLVNSLNIFYINYLNSSNYFQIYKIFFSCTRRVTNVLMDDKLFQIDGKYFNGSKRYYVHEKNDFVEESENLLDTDLKIILLNYQNNFVGTLKIMSNAVKIFYILTTSLNVLHNFASSTKLLF